MIGRPPTSNSTRFWQKVTAGPPDACWEWQGGATGEGYGAIYDNERRRSIGAHVLSYELHNKQKVPDGLFVLHKCDNPPCANPAHLFLGTAKKNSEDMAAKGRSQRGDKNASRRRPERLARGKNSPRVIHRERYPVGEKHYAARLTEEAVLAIRQAAEEGVPRHQIVKDFSKKNNVSESAIHHVLDGRTWKKASHEPPPTLAETIRRLG